MEDHQDGLGLEHSSCEERLTELDLFSLEKRWFQEELQAFQCPQGGCQDGASLFTVVSGRRTRDKGQHLKQENLMLDIKKNCFTVKSVRQGNRFLQAVV